MKTRYFEVEKVRDIDEDAREATFVVSTERAVQMGDDREVLRAAGAKLARYQKNPVLLDAHDRSSISSVIGSTQVSIKGTQLVARVRYAKTLKGEEAWSLVRDGHVRGTSIGYQVNPDKTRKLRKGEVDGEITGPASIVDEWELLEISNVPVPADEDAVRRSYAPKVRKSMSKLNYADLLEQLAEQERGQDSERMGTTSDQDSQPATPGEDVAEKAAEVTCPHCGKGFAPPARESGPPVTPYDHKVGIAPGKLGPGSPGASKMGSMSEQKSLGVEIQARALEAARRSALAITPPGLEDVTARALTEGRPFEEIRKLLLIAQKQRFSPLGTPEPEKRDDGGPTPKGLPTDISDDVLVRSLGNLGE